MGQCGSVVDCGRLRTLPGMCVRAVLLLCCLGLLLTGCAASRPEMPAGASPSDFSLDVAVLTQPADRSLEDDSGSYRVEPDGSFWYRPPLRDGPDGASEEPRDRLVRVLTMNEMAAVWDIVNQLGLDESAAEEAMGNLELVRPQPGERIYLAKIAAEGQHWAFARTLGGRGRDAQTPLADLAAVLADLSMEAREPGARTIGIPVRYDLGPDPYARYRR